MRRGRWGDCAPPRQAWAQMADIRFGDRLDRWLLKKGVRAEHPLPTIALIEARRIAASPFAQLRHRRDARELASNAEAGQAIDPRLGYRLFAPDAFPELPRVVTACEAVFARHRDAVTRNDGFNKRYFFNILAPEDLAAHRVLIEFALSAPVVAIVTRYLGHVPRLHSLGVFYSSVNDTIDGSQIYHVDGDARSQVKCFVNVWDVGLGSGAFTFLPKSLTSRALRHGGLLKSMSDEDVANAAAPHQRVAVTGPPGSGVFVDTSRCLHQGSRAREHPRLVFQFQYVSRPDALLPRSLAKKVMGGHVHVTRDLLAGLGLDDPGSSRLVD